MANIESQINSFRIDAQKESGDNAAVLASQFKQLKEQMEMDGEDGGTDIEVLAAIVASIGGDVEKPNEKIAKKYMAAIYNKGEGKAEFDPHSAHLDSNDTPWWWWVIYWAFGNFQYHSREWFYQKYVWAANLGLGTLAGCIACWIRYKWGRF